MSAFPATIARAARSGVSPEEAQALVVSGAFVLDVRPRPQYEDDGHIPGAALLPADALASAPAVVPEDGRAILVVCERGARSRQVATLLADAGIAGACYLEGGMRRWPGRREHIGTAPLGPSPWLLSNALLAPPGARTLDVACGRGRHALLLAAAGSPVRALDGDPRCVEGLGKVARNLRLPLDVELSDLSRGDTLGQGEWELVLAFDCAVRPLVPALVRALRPGGVLICEGFTREQGERYGSSATGAELLAPGELAALVSPLEILRAREGERDGCYLASVAARKRWASRSSASQETSEAAKQATRPATQRWPDQRAGRGASGRGHSTPGARKR